MAKYHGNVGFATFDETAPDVDSEFVIERTYFGDVLRNTKKWENGVSVNDNINVSNQISIVADQYARDNLFTIRYVLWMGARWIVNNVDVQAPRLILSIGGVYNGPTPAAERGASTAPRAGGDGQVPTQA